VQVSLGLSVTRKWIRYRVVLGVGGLAISGMPFMGPIGAGARGYIGASTSSIHRHATRGIEARSRLAGHRRRRTMVESEPDGYEEYPSCRHSHEQSRRRSKHQTNSRPKAGKPKWGVGRPPANTDFRMRWKRSRRRSRARMPSRKTQRTRNRRDQDRDGRSAAKGESPEVTADQSGRVFNLEYRLVASVPRRHPRIDGLTRKRRPIQIAPAYRPDARFALFTAARRALVVTTWARSNGRSSTVDRDQRAVHMHYNFPPFSVGRPA